MNPIDLIFRISKSIKIRCYHKIYLPHLRKQLKSCGNNVTIDFKSKLAGLDHMSIGNNVYIGPNATFYSTVANLNIGNYINMGPNVTIITGDHRTDVIGKYMSEVTDKLPENDKDVNIEDDVGLVQVLLY